MDWLRQDVKYAVRTLLRSPGFTLAAVLTLALGIGANTAIFSVVYGVLLRPLPYKDSGRLVRIWESSPTFPNMSVSYPDYKDWTARNSSFEAIAAARVQGFNLTGVDVPERLSARLVSANFFPLLGVAPSLGRVFTAEEDTVGGPKVLILSDALWRRKFAADPGVLGRTISLDGDPYQVVGVMPKGFQYFSPMDLYLPISRTNPDALVNRGWHPGIYAVGRLKPGVSVAQARAELQSIGKALGEEFPGNRGVLPEAASLQQAATKDVQAALWVLLAAVGMVLLIAVTNVANLLLARATVRQRELAVRAALGAGRRRLVAQLLVEAVLLSLVGGGLGAWLSAFGVDALSAARPDALPSMSVITVDGWVLGFTALLSLGAGLALGIVPALRVSNINLAQAMKDGDARTSSSSHQNLRRGLVIAEVALALMLLIGAGLMLRTFRELQSLELGYRQDKLLTFLVSTTPTSFPTPESLRTYARDLEAKLATVPGVKAVALSTGLPLAGASETGFRIAGQPEPTPEQQPMTVYELVTPSYRDALQLRLLSGRFLTAEDRVGRPCKVVVDQELARKYFPGIEAVGQRVLGFAPPPGLECEIVGVVGHVVHYGIGAEEATSAQLYLSAAQTPDTMVRNVLDSFYVSVRTESDPQALFLPLREAALSVNRDQPLSEVKTMEALVSESLGEKRFTLWLLGAFAALALILTGVGVAGVMSYLVAQRTHELGIRLALGAQASTLLRMVVGQGLRLTLWGIALGLLAAFALTRLMSGVLYGVSATDPVTYAAVAALIGLFALVATWWPARRVLRVDPAISLRAE